MGRIRRGKITERKGEKGAEVRNGPVRWFEDPYLFNSPCYGFLSFLVVDDVSVRPHEVLPDVFKVEALVSLEGFEPFSPDAALVQQ
jgi:hypothetical protein